MKKNVFIDGQEGTTGLGIRERLAGRADIELLDIPEPRRKDPDAKRAVISQADLVVLCLPDAAASEAARIAHEAGAKVIDASSVHRTQSGWTYGLPELSARQRDGIRSARSVANPGCYATGFLLAMRPLVDEGVVPPDYPVTVHALSGYSGGGKKLIAAYREHAQNGPSPDWTVRIDALTLSHKHVAEMRTLGGLSHPPLFCPAVGNYYQGMIVCVPLHVRALGGRPTPEDAHRALAKRYERERFVCVMPLTSGESSDRFLSPTACNGTNDVEIFVFGHEEQMLLVARLDNLGKGASGAAVQNMNLMLGFDEERGLGG